MAIHTVKKGDTLWKISRNYGVPIRSIMQLNNLKTDKLVLGLALYIPDKVPERFYQVRAGDTLWKIAQRFGTTVGAIIRVNPNINPYQLKIGERLHIPTLNKYRMETLGFIDAFETTSFDEFVSIANNLTYLAIFTYSFYTDGTLTGVNDSQLISQSKQYGVKPLMVLSNTEQDNFNPRLADQVLQNTNVRQKLVQNIVRTLSEKGYDGVSIDFEFVPPQRRNDFTAFLRELKTALGNRILHLNSHAKTSDLPNNRLVGFLDYRAIGNIVDLMAVMAVDYGYATSPPNPIAPTWWVEQVINYAVSQVNPRKLMLEIALYGYDWILPYTPHSIADMISANQAETQAINSFDSIQYDWRSEAPWYRYQKNGEQHTVWFEDIRSLVAKYRLVEIYNLRGVTFWQLHFKFTQNWAYIEKNIQVVRHP